MASRKSLVFLLLVLGAATAFDLSSYLYVTETNITVSYTNFTLNGSQYSLVKLGGTETFLLEDGTPMTDRAQIEEVMHTYYVSSYYPNATEIAELRSLITRFNNSRNDGYDFRGKEEYICRDDVLLSNGKVKISGQPVVCMDDESCQKVAMLLFSVYGEGLALGSPTAILGPLKNFTPYSITMDTLLADYTQRLDNLDASNVADTMDYIKTTSDTLKNSSLMVEQTIFRTPRLNDTADRTACQLKCWAICPSFDLDQAAVDSLKAKATALSTKVAPIGNYQSISTRISENTALRFNFAENESTAARFLASFDVLNDSGTQAVSLGQAAASHVSNATLSSKLDRLRALHSAIPEDIENRDFTSLESDLFEYDSLTDDVQNLSIQVMIEYNETLAIRNRAASTLLAVESRDLNPASQAYLDLLKNKSSDLDAAFREGLTVEQLRSMRSNFTLLTDDAQQLLKTETDLPATRVLLLFRGLAMSLNTGFFNLAETTGLMNPRQIPQEPLTTFGIFSALVFLAFSAVVILLFLYVLVSFRFTIPGNRRILGSAVFCTVILLLGFSVLLYLFLNKTATNAILREFLADFETRNSTMIVVDIANASYADSQAMGSCARNLADSLSQKNKTWTLYTLSGSGCAWQSSEGRNSTATPVSTCQEEIDASSSSFLLKYASVTEQIKFSTVYVNRAEINADSEYYDSCPLVALFG